VRATALGTFSVLAAWTALVAGQVLAAAPAAKQTSARIELKRDDQQGQLQILIDGKEALVYCYGKRVDLPHFFPVRSPSGKSLTIQQTEPYPHHRSIWFADTVQLAGGRKASFYNAFYSRLDRKDPDRLFRDRIRHVDFLPATVQGNVAELGMRLVWEMDQNTPVLDESRQMRIVALEQGEYFLDLKFKLLAAYGDVSFVSDAAHYAWPYVRMSPEFSVQKGGRITNSAGGIDQKGTNGKPAHWVDYSNTVAGMAEGLAIFSHPENGYPHTWLTRDYGTFGPRRPDPRNGKPFTIKKGDTIGQRVGILVHSGDVKSGRVAERYRQYAEKGSL